MSIGCDATAEVRPSSAARCPTADRSSAFWRRVSSYSFPRPSTWSVRPTFWFAGRFPYNNAQRNGFFWRPVGRLREGATLDRARSEAELVAADIRRNFPIYGPGVYHVRIEPMHQY